MCTLVVGASGATGRQLVAQLVSRGEDVKVIVRSGAELPAAWKSNDRVAIIQANVLEIEAAALARHVEGCQAVASCLGHNLTWKGIFGEPRSLVTDAVRVLCHAIEKNGARNARRVKFVLMNTTGNKNRDLNETMTVAEKIVLGLIRLLVPPHSDNERAADYLRVAIGQEASGIEWVVVRPDSLRNEAKVSEYEVFPSPTRSPLFHAGKTSRINVAHFMARLITEKASWDKWKGQMPVIYNKVHQQQ